MTPQIPQLIGQAIECFQSGLASKAEELLLEVLKIDRDCILALEISSFIKTSQGNFQEAENYLDQILKIHPENPQGLRLTGVLTAHKKQWLLALDYFNKSLQSDPNNSATYSNIGNAQAELGLHDQALLNYEKAISIEENNAEAWSNKGNVLSELKRFEEAISNYDKAIALEPTYAEAWSNKGNALTNLRRYDQAIFYYDHALLLNREYAEAWSNKGACLGFMDCFDDALLHVNNAILIKPNCISAWLNKGQIYGDKKLLALALESYQNALTLDGNSKFLHGLILSIQNDLGIWIDRSNQIESLIKKLTIGERVTPTFPLFAMSDNPGDHLKAAIIWTNSEYPQNHFLGPIEKYANPKIKIAYFSADFNDHPVSYLMAELFELHDRNRFEVYAFSLKRAHGSPMRDRLISIFDHFIDVDEKTDQEITKLARDLKIDIAIDLNGHTQNYRTRIFAYRAAPIQVNYLGYPGTMGAQYMDYIIADRVVIPQEYQEYYLEKKVYLPHSYMVDDSTRIPSNKQFSRSDFNLPNDAIVFCCFNNSYKFTPERVSSFAKILLNTPKSVLWVTENNASFRKNIAAEFSKLGVTEDRIIFAGRVDPMEDHLARYRLADLFLDTSPYNAHTTGLDSLKAGVPVITLAGKSFASRVGASLLTAIDLPELIVHSEEAFVELASKLGNDHKALNVLKEKLIANYKKAPLFDSKLYCKHLEMAYQEMHRLSINNLPPANIDINQ